MIRVVESNFITSAVNPTSYPETLVKDFAFVGRSNVGKSSMINTITNRKLLAKIANKPGKTRLINFFEIKYKKEENDIENNKLQQSFILVDLPGYGYAKVSKTEREQWKKMIESYFKTRKQLSGAIVLVDIRHEADPKDVLMVRLLQDLNIQYLIAATKCDKIPKNQIRSKMKHFASEFSSLNITEFSSLKRIGIDNVLCWIENLL